MPRCIYQKYEITHWLSSLIVHTGILIFLQYQGSKIPTCIWKCKVFGHWFIFFCALKWLAKSHINIYFIACCSFHAYGKVWFTFQLCMHFWPQYIHKNNDSVSRTLLRLFLKNILWFLDLDIHRCRWPCIRQENR